MPEDLSVVGFDDTPPPQRARPALTTVRQPHRAKGEAAARQLLRPPERPASRGFPVGLVVQDSTAPPPGR